MFFVFVFVSFKDLETEAQGGQLTNRWPSVLVLMGLRGKASNWTQRLCITYSAVFFPVVMVSSYCYRSHTGYRDGQVLRDADVFSSGKAAAGTSRGLQKCIRWKSKIKGFQAEGAGSSKTWRQALAYRAEEQQTGPCGRTSRRAGESSRKRGGSD